MLLYFLGLFEDMSPSVFNQKEENKPRKHKPKQKHRDKVRHSERTEARDSDVRQCLGPGCVELARPNSKYCSDDCGMKLAAK